MLEAVLAEKPGPVRGLVQGHGAGGNRTWMPIPQTLRPPSPQLLPGSTAGPALSVPNYMGLGTEL